MSHRLEQLETRRRQLLLRSERLRAELAADHRILVEGVGKVERVLGMVKRLASPVLLAGGSALLFGLLKRFRPLGLVMRGIQWIPTARRLIAVLALIRAATRSRSRQVSESQT